MWHVIAFFFCIGFISQLETGHALLQKKENSTQQEKVDRDKIRNAQIEYKKCLLTENINECLNIYNANFPLRD
jgi:hypothetical protein